MLHSPLSTLFENPKNYLNLKDNFSMRLFGMIFKHYKRASVTRQREAAHVVYDSLHALFPIPMHYFICVVVITCC